MSADDIHRSTFEFRDSGTLVDGDLGPILTERFGGDPSRGLVPYYKFEIRSAGTGSSATWISGAAIRVTSACTAVISMLPEHRGNRYAAHSCTLLLPLVREHGLETLWITCNLDNVASGRTCEILGADLVEKVDLRRNTNAYRKGERQKHRYKIELW